MAATSRGVGGAGRAAQDAGGHKGPTRSTGSRSASVLSARTPLCVDSRPFTLAISMVAPTTGSFDATEMPAPTSAPLTLLTTWDKSK